MSSDITNTAPLDDFQGAPTVIGENLKMTYRRRQVLDVDRIEIAAGETYVLLGESGAGKSTLLRILGLLERPTGGTVSIDGRTVRRNDLATRRQIAAVFQKPYLLRGNVAQNVGYGLKLRRVPRAERRRRVSDILASVGLEGWEKRSALTMSGGEAQRVALARALVLRPRFLLLDEPLSYLDPLLKRQLALEFARILEQAHVTALYVTHDQDEAAVIADRIGVMRGGRVVAEGHAESVLALPADEWVASFVGTQLPVEGTVSASEDGLATLSCGGTDVYAVSDLPVRTDVAFGVRPEDVMLFEDGIELPRTSARNQLSCVVSSLTPSGAAMQVVLDAGCLRLASTVSHGSAVALGLAEGIRVNAVFKATAVRVAPRWRIG